MVHLPFMLSSRVALLAEPGGWLSFLAEETSGLAEDVKPDADPRALIWRGLLLIGLLMVLFVVIKRVKKNLGDEEASAGAGFTLADLRDLHRKGQLTDEEFEKARGKMVASAKAAIDRAEAERAKAQADAKAKSLGLTVGTPDVGTLLRRAGVDLHPAPPRRRGFDVLPADGSATPNQPNGPATPPPPRGGPADQASGDERPPAGDGA